MSGTDYERKLWLKLWNRGYACMRAPSSGGGRKHPQPDLLVARRENSGEVSFLRREIYAIEVKRTSNSAVYLDKEEILELETFVNRWGGNCILVIAVRFNKPVGWNFAGREDLEVKKKSYKLHETSEFQLNKVLKDEIVEKEAEE